MTSPLLSPKIICKVRALYLYQSPDTSSLSFEAGDCIDVLAKLESGWWDGCCEGRRGWFPSNYVEIIDHTPSYMMDRIILPPAPKMGDLKRVSLQSSGSSDISKDETSLPDGWTIQVNEGRLCYFNENTGKTLDYHLFPEHEDVVHDIIIDRKNSSIFKKNRESVESFDSDDDMFVGDLSASALMEKWRERKTPKGRVYYCNMLTQETTWDYNDIDPETGRLRKTADMEGNSFLQPICSSQKQFLEDTGSAELTWNRLATDVALTIHQLSTAAQMKQYEQFPQKTADIVESVRLMFYASNSMEKDTELVQNPIFRDPRRAIISSLSKLILSSNFGFESATIQNVLIKMPEKIQHDTNDLLVAVRNFVIVCQKHKIKVEPMNPKLLDKSHITFPNILNDNKTVNVSGITLQKDSVISNDSTLVEVPKRPQSDPNPLGSKHRFFLNQDLVLSLQTYAHQIYKFTRELSEVAHATLQKSENKLNITEDRAKTLNVFQSISNQISKYMVILDDISLDHLDSHFIPSVAYYRLGRQNLYTSIAHLFGSIQSITSIYHDLKDSVNAIQLAIEDIEAAIENIEVSVIAMANERRRMIASNTLVLDDIPPPSPIETESRMDITDESSEIGSTEESNRSVSSRTNRSVFNNIEIRVNRRTQYICRADHDTNECPNEIEFCTDNTVKGGTLAALVERLTGHDVLDTNFIATFLLTYRSFCTTEEFIALLEDRYNMLPPERLTPEELDIWTERKQKLVRLRVFNVLKNWLENYYIDEDAYLLSRIEYFTNTSIRDVSASAADKIINLTNRHSNTTMSELKKIVQNQVHAPDPIYPKNIHHFQLADIDPIELARQLSIMDFGLYSSIRTIECLGKAWSREDEDELNAANIKKSIMYCNRLTSWVTECILSHEEPRKRAMEIKYWAQVAEQCRNINNFNTCMAILSAFDNSAIGRLKKTWMMCSKTTIQSLTQLRKILGANRNFTEYRDIIHSVNHPCIPFLGIYLQDLTFIEDGNPDYLRATENLINFAKRYKAAEIIRELRQFQAFPYSYKSIAEIQNYIKIRLNESHEVEQLYERSLFLEPRTAE